jgi:hypothetical protein
MLENTEGQPRWTIQGHWLHRAHTIKKNKNNTIRARHHNTQKYHTLGTVPKPNRKFVNTQIYDDYLFKYFNEKWRC